MLDLFYGLEPDLALHATVFVLGCAIFCGVLLCSRCPRCSWLEWVTERSGEDDKDKE